MEIINYWALAGGTLFAFILGAVWYSPLMFGNLWAKINGADKYTKEELQKLEKEMTKFYLLQLFLTILTMFVLYQNIKYFGAEKGIWFALFMWLGYVMPTQVAGVIWSNTEKKYWFKQICILASCQLVAFLVAGYIFSVF